MGLMLIMPLPAACSITSGYHRAFYLVDVCCFTVSISKGVSIFSGII